jgi:hypothetical protein
MAVPVFLIHCL